MSSLSFIFLLSMYIFSLYSEFHLLWTNDYLYFYFFFGVYINFWKDCDFFIFVRFFTTVHVYYKTFLISGFTLLFWNFNNLFIKLLYEALNPFVFLKILSGVSKFRITFLPYLIRYVLILKTCTFLQTQHTLKLSPTSRELFLFRFYICI